MLSTIDSTQLHVNVKIWNLFFSNHFTWRRLLIENIRNVVNFHLMEQLPLKNILYYLIVSDIITLFENQIDKFFKQKVIILNNYLWNVQNACPICNYYLYFGFFCLSETRPFEPVNFLFSLPIFIKLCEFFDD